MLVLTMMLPVIDSTKPMAKTRVLLPSLTRSTVTGAVAEESILLSV